MGAISGRLTLRPPTKNCGIECANIEKTSTYRAVLKFEVPKLRRRKEKGDLHLSRVYKEDGLGRGLAPIEIVKIVEELGQAEGFDAPHVVGR